MICLLAATPLESAQLRQQLPFEPTPFLPGRSYTCSVFGEELMLLHCGIGIASAASVLSQLLCKKTPELLIAFGCGGSYSGLGLNNGDLAVATSECFGDLGALQEDGFVALEDMGLPAADPPLFHQKISLDSLWTQAATETLQKAPELDRSTIQAGPFVTVNTLSGTVPLSEELEARTNGICENMEGAALAQVAVGFNTPLIEVRGISNPCGTRDRAQWDLPAGMTVAQQAVLRLLRDLPFLRSQACS